MLLLVYIFFYDNRCPWHNTTLHPDASLLKITRADHKIMIGFINWILIFTWEQSQPPCHQIMEHLKVYLQLCVHYDYCSFVINWHLANTKLFCDGTPVLVTLAEMMCQPAFYIQLRIQLRDNCILIRQDSRGLHQPAAESPECRWVLPHCTRPDIMVGS